MEQIQWLIIFLYDYLFIIFFFFTFSIHNDAYIQSNNRENFTFRCCFYVLLKNIKAMNFVLKTTTSKI